MEVLMQKYRYKEYICTQCGKVFIARDRGKKRIPKFCSKECYSESLTIHRYCEFCGKEILARGKRKNKKYCSAECRAKSRIGTKLGAEWCKALSEGRKNSPKCHGENLYNWKGGKENRLRYNKNKYYSKKTLGKLDFNYLDILYWLQNGKCFYCGCDISNYKAIEHTNPISLGGTNENTNLIYSCRSCNSKKNAKRFEDFCMEINKPHLPISLEIIHNMAKIIYNIKYGGTNG